MNTYAKIYKATNQITNELYIGFTTQPIEKRWQAHIKKAKYSDYKFHRAILKYGPENFLIEEIYTSKDKEHCLQVMEPYFIKLYNSYMYVENHNGYNMTAGGYSISQYNKINKPSVPRKPLTPEQRKTLSLSKLGIGKGIPLPDETKSKMKISQKLRWETNKEIYLERNIIRPKTIWINKDGDIQKIKLDEFEYWKSLGYQRGKMSSPKKIWITKDNKNKSVTPHKFEYYENLGYVRGRTKTSI